LLLVRGHLRGSWRLCGSLPSWCSVSLKVPPLSCLGVPGLHLRFLPQGFLVPRVLDRTSRRLDLRDARGQRGDDAPRLGVCLPLGLELLAQDRDRLVLRLDQGARGTLILDSRGVRSWSGSTNTYTRPSSPFSEARDPLLTRILTASLLVPSSSAASVSVTRRPGRDPGCGSPIVPSRVRPRSAIGSHVLSKAVHMAPYGVARGRVWGVPRELRVTEFSEVPQLTLCSGALTALNHPRPSLGTADCSSSD
jgi:hypothetical protein